MMRTIHVFLALAVAVVWGVNFVIIDIGLAQFPPLFFAALRFAFTAIPAIFFLRRPKVSWTVIAAVGIFLGVGYFGLLFLGMHLGMPAGLASLVLQSQAVFTLVFAVVLLGERLGLGRVVGTVLATAGIVVIAAGTGGITPLVPMLLVLGGAASWAAANICIRSAGTAASLNLLVWSSIIPPIPLTVLSLLVEGPDAVLGSVVSVGFAPLASLAYLVILATLFGFGAWNHLLGLYPASNVAPFSLLVPVFGLASAYLLLGERPGVWELVGSAVVLAGLVAVMWPARRRPSVRSSPSPSTEGVTS